MENHKNTQKSRGNSKKTTQITKKYNFSHTSHAKFHKNYSQKDAAKNQVQNKLKKTKIHPLKFKNSQMVTHFLCLKVKYSQLKIIIKIKNQV